MLADSLLMTFTQPAGFIGMDTTVSFQNQIVNYILQQIPFDTVDFWMKPYTVNADSVPLLTVPFKWGDANTDNYSVGADAGDIGRVHASAG